MVQLIIYIELSNICWNYPINSSKSLIFSCNICPKIFLRIMLLDKALQQLVGRLVTSYSVNLKVQLLSNFIVDLSLPVMMVMVIDDGDVL